MSSPKTWFGSALKGWLVLAGVIFVAQAAVLHVLTLPERDLPVPPLQSLPEQVGEWKAYDEQSLEPGVLAYLRPDSYVLRDYANQTKGRSVNLFVAYFKSLQNAYGPHSPSVCLPGSGWLVRSSQIRPVTVPGYPKGIPVNEYVLEKNDDRIVVLYWYQNDRNVWAQEFQAKLTLLPDLIRYRRSDVSLVRLVAPFRGEDAIEDLAQTRQFAGLIFPFLVADFRRGD